MAVEKIRLRPIIHKKAVVMLGMFDGMHIGHMELVSTALKVAREKGLYTVMYTFRTPPKNVLGNGDTVKLLSAPEEKISLVRHCRIDMLAFEQFDKPFSLLSPSEFFDRLCSEFDISDIVVGFNYSFGAGAQGDCAELLRLAQGRGIKVHIVLPVTDGEDTVSSTLIKRLLSEGELERANRLLGRAYSVSGTVVDGKKKARKMGFPTANISYAQDKQLPANGVYAAICSTQTNSWHAVCNIGVAPTMRTDGEVLLECYMLSGAGDLYDDTLTVKFYKRIREERAFASEKELADRIATDVELARAYLSTYVR